MNYNQQNTTNVSGLLCAGAKDRPYRKDQFIDMLRMLKSLKLRYDNKGGVVEEDSVRILTGYIKAVKGTVPVPDAKP